MSGGIARGRLAGERKAWRKNQKRVRAYTCASRLAGERKAWRKNHPRGFDAKPEKLPNGTVNLKIWHCKIPGKPGTDWQGGYYPLTLHFSEYYPSKPPVCKFPPGFFHPDVMSSGTVCHKILNEYRDWRPEITVVEILVEIRDMLDRPSCRHMLTLQEQDPEEYKRLVREQAQQYFPPLSEIFGPL